MEKKIVFFDLETNGLTPDWSVLAIAAIRCLFTGNTLERDGDPFIRYYFRKPGEPVNSQSIKINGLTDAVITDKRKTADYGLYFRNDQQSFRDYCRDTAHYVGHNISFDRQFIDFTPRHTFCTMYENTDIVRIMGKNGHYKWPKLDEAARFYGITTDAGSLHDCSYDVFLTYRIFDRMLFFDRTRDRVLKFLMR